MNIRINELLINKWANSLVVSFQGCLRRCQDCPNKGIQPMYGGNKMDTNEIKKRLMKDPTLTGISFMGGEPFLQPLAALDLARFAHAKGKTVWCQTHYFFEQIVQWEDSRKELIKEIDILLDEPYSMSDDGSTACKTDCGERNQRIINIKKSLKEGEAVLYDGK